MKKISLFIIMALLIFTGCSQNLSVPVKNNIESQSQDKDKDKDKGNEKEIENKNGDTSLAGDTFDIHFKYKNHLYKYDLDAKWTNVCIKKEGLNLLASLGTEVLLDGTVQAFGEIDADHSETISRDEWSDYEDDFSFDGINGGLDETIDLEEFGYFTAQLNGVELLADSHEISQPSLQDYAIRMDDETSPVSLKILRAGKGGYKAMHGVVFEENTIFIELQSEFEVYLKESPDMELSPGFLTPLLSMMLEKDYEKNNHGALGFSSIVNTEEFNSIFKGGTFSLEYKGKGETGVLDEYFLTIEPN